MSSNHQRPAASALAGAGAARPISISININVRRLLPWVLIHQTLMFKDIPAKPFQRALGQRAGGAHEPATCLGRVLEINAVGRNIICPRRQTSIFSLLARRQNLLGLNLLRQWFQTWRRYTVARVVKLQSLQKPFALPRVGFVLEPSISSAYHPIKHRDLLGIVCARAETAALAQFISGFKLGL